MDAIEKTGEYRTGGVSEEEVSEAAQNEASLAQLQQMMRGIR